MLGPDARAAFREAVDVDDDSWARGAGWALSTGVGALAYYRDSSPVMAGQARWLVDQVLADR
jgi:hypothetical protein